MTVFTFPGLQPAWKREGSASPNFSLRSRRLLLNLIEVLRFCCHKILRP